MAIKSFRVAEDEFMFEFIKLVLIVLGAEDEDEEEEVADEELDVLDTVFDVSFPPPPPPRMWIWMWCEDASEAMLCIGGLDICILDGRLAR